MSFGRKSNVVDRVYARTSENPAQIALIAGDRLVSFGELREIVDAVACELGRFDLPREAERVPRIGLYCEDGIEYVVLALGILRSGGCLVPIAGELNPVEREQLVQATRLDAILLGPGREWRGSLAVDHPAPLTIGRLTTVSPSAMLLRVATPGASSDSAAAVVAALGDRPFAEAAFASLDPAFIRFSSGTTQSRKGIVLGHSSLLARIDAANAGVRITPCDRVVWVLPMSHHFAVSIMLYLTSGATTILSRSHLGPDVLASARRYGGTVFYGAPFHVAMLAAEPSGKPWPTLRLAVSTAAALPEATARSFTARFGRSPAQGLGIIECGLATLNIEQATEKPGSVGRPMPTFQVRVQRPLEHEVSDDPADPPVYGRHTEVGEILLRGPGMLDAYLSPWMPQDAILRDGWFATGDLGYVDADGDLFLVGRTRSVINVAGLKCFPEEVEARLIEHPEVVAARVYARLNARVGAVPAAEIVPRSLENPPTVAALTRHCRAALATYKIPVEFHFVADVQRTASGKIRR